MALGALLFAQAALAGAAGAALQRSPARAFAAPESMLCHQAPQDSRNANLCLADCLSFDQSSDTPQLPALAAEPAPVLIVPLDDRTVVRVAAIRFRLPHPPSPPPRILFRVLRI